MMRSTAKRTRSEEPIEAYLVQMNKKRKEGSPLEKEEAMQEAVVLTKKVSGCLIKVKESYDKRDFFSVDALAQQVLECALKIGAPDLLNMAIDLQTLARCKDEEGLLVVMGLLDVEVGRIVVYLSKTSD